MHPREDMQFVRLTFEILRPVPASRLHVLTEVSRGGRRVERLVATMSDDQGTPVMLASAWRIRTMELPLTDGIEGEEVPGPDDLQASTTFFMKIPDGGYLQAMETRFVTGDWAQPGAATVWFRMRYPLLPDTPTSPLARVLNAADSANGVSSRFNGLFINPDLTVYLTRPAVGDWVGLQANTTLTNHGIGLATSIIHDRSGPVGRGSQSLLLDVMHG